MSRPSNGRAWRSVAIVGVPGTGKSEFARQLSTHMVGAELLPDFASNYTAWYGEIEHPAEQMLMLQTADMAESAYVRMHPSYITVNPSFMYGLYGAWSWRNKTVHNTTKCDAFVRKFLTHSMRGLEAFDAVCYLPWQHTDGAQYERLDTELYILLSAHCRDSAYQRVPRDSAEQARWFAKKFPPQDT